MTQSSADYQKATSTVTLTLAGGSLRRPFDLEDAFGEKWKGRHLQFPEQWNATPGVVIVGVVHSAQSGAKVKQIGGSQLEPDSAVMCTIPVGQTCWLTDTSGQTKLGITAKSVNAAAGRLELTLQVRQ